MNREDMNILIGVMQNIASAECKNVMKQCNVGHNVYATVVAIDADEINHSIWLAGGTDVYTGIKNKSNTVLKVGDAVLVEAINGNIGNGFIIAKMGGYKFEGGGGGGSETPETFVYIQSTPSREWVVQHNLDKFPSVTVVDSAGTIVVGEYTYIDTNTVKCTFSSAFAGKCILN